MTIYIVPHGNMSDEVTSVLSRAGYPYITEGTLAEKIVKALLTEAALVSVDEAEIAAFTRNINHFIPRGVQVHPLKEVPGLTATPMWSQHATRMHSVDWLSLEPVLLKAGHTAVTKDDIQERAQKSDHGSAGAFDALFAREQAEGGFTDESV